MLFSARVSYRAWDGPDAFPMLQAVLKKALRNVDWSQFVQEAQEAQVVEGRITLKRKLARPRFCTRAGGRALPHSGRLLFSS